MVLMEMCERQWEDIHQDGLTASFGVCLIPGTPLGQEKSLPIPLC